MNGYVRNIIDHQSNNPLNELGTNMNLGEVDRICKYSYSPILLQKWSLEGYLIARYTFIREIRRVCERGDLTGVMTKIVPELESLSYNVDNNVLIALLEQFEYISKVLE